MTPLEALIRADIEANGPMRLDEYMGLCLGHPQHGYYMSQSPFGKDGDFTTAPEISQMFGEILGLWIGDLWTRQGKPKNPFLVELGPGRGTLMRDMRRALNKVPDWPDDVAVHFVETSPALRVVQKTGHPDAQWHENFEDIKPRGPLYCIANELFDALPIRQFVRENGVWKELHVAIHDDRLEPRMMDAPKAHFNSEDDTIETCEPGAVMCQQIASAVHAKGGAALIIDYGYTEGSGDSFQAIQRHKYANPFEAPGQADLTAHVNFKRLACVAKEHCQVHGPTTQGAFLLELGLGLRARALGGSAVKDAARLADPDQMGGLFKVLALMPENSPQPAGFGACR